MTLPNIFTNLSLSDMETCYRVFRGQVILGIRIEEGRFGFKNEVISQGGTNHLPYLRVRDRLLRHAYAEGKMIHRKVGVRAISYILKYRCPRDPGIVEGRDKRVQFRRESGLWDEEKKNP